MTKRAADVKDLNIWSYMSKISPDKEAKMSDEEKLNLLNDGFGNVYLPPKKGATKLYCIDGDDTFYYRYNFERGVIEVFAYEPLPDVNNFEWIYEEGCSIGNFADSPEYWTRVLATELQDMGYQEAEEFNELVNNNNEVKEDYSLFGDDFADKEEYEYMIKASINFDFPDDFDWDNYYDVVEKYAKYIESKSKKTYLYTEPLEISCSYSENTGTVYIKCIFTMPMTKDDLMDIWDEYEHIVENPEGIDYGVSVYDLDMVEV